MEMANLSSNFIRKYPVITALLRALTTKNTELNWTHHCQTYFDKTLIARSLSQRTMIPLVNSTYSRRVQEKRALQHSCTASPENQQQ